MTSRWSFSWMVVGLSWVALACNAPDGGEPLMAPGRIPKMPAAAAPVIIKPLAAAKSVNSSPDTGAAPIAGAVVDARILVLTAKGDSSAFSAIQATLQYLGTPFDVLNASTGATLTADILASGAHGKYSAVFLDAGDLSVGGASAFTDAEWAALTTYEAQFGVRRVSLYTSPSAAYGFVDNDIGVEVHITECDFRIGLPLDDNKTQLQNKFYADLLQACIDAPNCSHFTVWGLSDLDSWVPSTFPDYDFAHLFDKNLMPMANVQC